MAHVGTKVVAPDFIPGDIRQVMERLYRAGHHVWLVGGALRDFLMGLAPQDWDLVVDADPQKIVDLFPRVIPVGLRHGTVRIHTRLRDIEVTTCKLHGHAGILADLARRDFTVNALALSYPEGSLLDPHDGRRDLGQGLLRAVGDARSRFREDPLRTLRAGRFVSTRGFRIQRNTFQALRNESEGLKRVAAERVREEMCKMILGAEVVVAFEWMRRGGVTRMVFPELLEGYRKKQTRQDKHDIYRHILHTVQLCPVRARVRLAALFHDIARPRVRLRVQGRFHFPGFSRAGARIAEEVMMRWRMSRREIQEVCTLVENQVPREHPELSDAAVRRLMSRVGLELLEDLLALCEADHRARHARSSASGALKRLRSQIARQHRDKAPLFMDDLAIDGDDVMRILTLRPGPDVGAILRCLHQIVLEDPALNRRDILVGLLERDFKESKDATVRRN